VNVVRVSIVWTHNYKVNQNIREILSSLRFIEYSEPAVDLITKPFGKGLVKDTTRLADFALSTCHFAPQ